MGKKHLHDIRKEVLLFEANLKEAKEVKQKVQLKYDEGNLSKNEFDKRVKEMNEALQTDYAPSSRILNILDNYEKELNEWAQLDAADLTDDAKLFNSPLELSDEDYKRLEDEYQHNYTMLKAIKDHAKQKEITYTSLYSIDPEEKYDSFSEIVRVANNIVQTLQNQGSFNYMGMLWSDLEKFDNLYKEYFVKTQIMER